MVKEWRFFCLGLTMLLIMGGSINAFSYERHDDDAPGSPASDCPINVPQYDVRDFGAIGTPLQGSVSFVDEYTVQTLDGRAGSWVAGAGIGIQGAIALPNRTVVALVATIDSVEENGLIHLVSDPTRRITNFDGQSHAVTNDDSLPIQRALNCGRTVYAPEGVYMLGTSNATYRYDGVGAYANQPLLIGDTTSFVGDNYTDPEGVRHRTVLKLQDDVLQLFPQALQDNNPYYKLVGRATPETYTIDNAVLMNSHNLTYFCRRPNIAGCTHAGTNSNVTIRDLQIDGNKDRQSAFYVPRDNTSGQLANATPSLSTRQWNAAYTSDHPEPGTQMVDVTPRFQLIDGRPPAPSLVTRGHYVVFARYALANGLESGATNWSDSGPMVAPSAGGPQAALRVNLPPFHPPGAVAVNGYVAWYETDWLSRPGPDDDLDRRGNLIFERQSFPLANPSDPRDVYIRDVARDRDGRPLTVTYGNWFKDQPYVEIFRHQTPPRQIRGCFCLDGTRREGCLNDCSRLPPDPPPGYYYYPGNFIEFRADQAVTGIDVDHVNGLTLNNVEIVNSIANGLLLNGDTDNVNGTALKANDNAQSGLFLTGRANHIRFTDSSFDRNGRNGLDIEFQYNGTTNDLSFENCTFNYDASRGVTLSSVARWVINGARFDGCEFTGTAQPFFSSTVSGDGSGTINNLWITNSIFHETTSQSLVILSQGSSPVIAHNTFDQADGRQFTAAASIPDSSYAYGARFWSSVVFTSGANLSGWNVIDNTFIPTADSNNNSLGIEMNDNGDDFVISGNYYYNTIQRDYDLSVGIAGIQRAAYARGRLRYLRNFSSNDPPPAQDWRVLEGWLPNHLGLYVY